ncbi:MAG TPA: TIGR03118 family protein [Streptosporangiaceae bacterium]
MLKRLRSPRPLAVLIAAASGLALAAPTAALASSGHGHHHHGDLKLNQVNLASDIPGMAPLTDPDLKNPWGISLLPTSPLWISNQGTNSSTLYTLTPGSSTVTKVPTVPPTGVRVTMGDSFAGPTGQVANTGSGFVLSNGTSSAPAAFIFDTLDGHIEAWNPAIDPHIGNTENKATVPGASYTGLALASTSNGDELFAANFGQGKVDVFDSAFKQVTTARWQFRDARLPRGFKPFNTQALNGKIFVTFDKADPSTGREAVGKHLGVVDEFSTSGRLIARIASRGALNAPWGLAIAPASWGSAAGSLLIGNFGDGRINIIAKRGNHFAHHITGQVVVTSTGKPFTEPGLWGLLPGTATNGGTNALWFTSGINHEQDGLLGVLRP